jgi:hypothetical protein
MSSGNRIPNVCTDRQRGMRSAVPGAIARSSAKPSSRARNVLAV